MATYALSGKAVDASQNPIPLAQISAQPVSGPAFLTGGGEILAEAIYAIAAADGTWSLLLTSNLDITPAGSAYSVTERDPRSGQTVTFTVVMPRANSRVIDVLSAVVSSPSAQVLWSQIVGAPAIVPPAVPNITGLGPGQVPIGTAGAPVARVLVNADVGTVVADLAARALLTDARFTDQRTPLDASVTDAKVVSVAQGKVTGLGAALTAKAPLSALAFWTPQAGGVWWPNPLMVSEATYSRGLNTLVLHPFFSGVNGVTIDQFDHYISTAGVAGAVVRIGVYTIDNQLSPFVIAAGVRWATLLVDLGLVATDTTGRKILTAGVAVVIPPLTWFAVGGVEQVATSTARVAGPVAGGGSPFGGSNQVGSYYANKGLGVQMASVSGALPAAFIDGGIPNLDSGVGIHVSAS